MRIRIAMLLLEEIAVPINQQAILAETASRLIQASIGQVCSSGEIGHQFYTFSPLRAERRFPAGAELRLGPGSVEWLISSPFDSRIRAIANQIRSDGELGIGGFTLPVRFVRSIDTRGLADTRDFTCISPIVAPYRTGSRFYQPQDVEFSEVVRTELLRKFSILNAAALPADDSLNLVFDSRYLARHRATKRIDLGGRSVIGAFCPFRLEGSEELIHLALDCGLGHLNEKGFGMIAPVARPMTE